MREIKFRAWDKSKELLVNAELILGIRFDRRHQEPALITYTKKMKPSMEISDLDKIFCNEFELMQYTGLKDKNGTEIYERDVVKVTSLEYGVKTIGKVAWGMSDFNHGNYPAFCIPEFESELNSFSQILDTGDYEIEVIGNIYEHPELLEVD